MTKTSHAELVAIHQKIESITEELRNINAAEKEWAGEHIDDKDDAMIDRYNASGDVIWCLDGAIDGLEGTSDALEEGIAAAVKALGAS